MGGEEVFFSDFLANILNVSCFWCVVAVCPAYAV
jgi:hypothetical protein